MVVITGALEFVNHADNPVNCTKLSSKRAKHLRIAHVLPQDSGSKEAVKFISAMEANRGETTGEFETFKQAKDWLLRRQKADSTKPKK